MRLIPKDVNKKVYIAGASVELERYRRAVTLAEEFGLEVVGRWDRAIERHGSQMAGAPWHRRANASAAIREAIRDAAGFVLLPPPFSASTRGAFWEAGFAEGCVRSWSRHVGLTASRAAGGNFEPEFILAGCASWAHHELDEHAIEACAAELQHETTSFVWEGTYPADGLRVTLESGPYLRTEWQIREALAQHTGRGDMCEVRRLAPSLPARLLPEM